MSSPSLPLGRYYPVLIETGLEAIEVDHLLHAERLDHIVPDLLDRRMSSLQGLDIILYHYDCEEPYWPFILLCQWPQHYTKLVDARSDMFAR